MAERLRAFTSGITRVSIWTWAALLGVVALGIRLPLILADHAVTPGGDSQGYLLIADSVAAGEGFDGAYRTPGYPLFILFVDFLLPGGRIANIVIVQHAMAVAFVVLVVLLAARWFDVATALIAGTVLAATPVLPYLEHAVLSDFVFSLVVFAFGAMLGKALSREHASIRTLAGLGALAAAAAYLRPSGQALILAVAIGALLATWRIKPTLRATLVAAAAFAICVSPWIARNAISFGEASMSTVTGDTLFVRAFEVDGLDIPTDRPTGQLAADVAASRGELRLVTAVTLAFQEAGLTRQQTLEAQQSLATTAISRHPFTYAVGTLEEMGRLRIDPRDVNIGSDVGPHLPAPPSPTKEIWDVSNFFSGIWWALSLGMFAGLLVLVAPRRESRMIGIGLTATWFALALGTALGRGALTRYALELAPVAVLLGSYGAVVIGRAIVDAVGSVSPRSGRDSAPAHAVPGTGEP